MKILLIDTVYPEFVRWMYETRPELFSLDYKSQVAATLDTCYHNVSVWADPLRQLGYDVHEIWAGHVPQHLAWVRENMPAGAFADYLAMDPMTALVELPKIKHWFVPIVAEQARAIKPDVIWLSNLYTFDDAFLASIDGSYRYAVGQNAAIPPQVALSRLDFAVSASKFNMQFFRDKGLRAELLPHGFNTRILNHIDATPPPKQFGFTFTGNMYPAHSERRQALTKLVQSLPMHVYTDARLPKDMVGADTVLSRALWGVDMYRVVQKSKIVFNIHLDSTGDWATNQRLYEVTGVGSLLVTDAKSNMADLFDLGGEALVYNSIEECIELVRYYLDAEEEREAIAKRGRRRTLTDHTTHHRGLLIDAYIKRHLLR